MAGALRFGELLSQLPFVAAGRVLKELTVVVPDHAVEQGPARSADTEVGRGNGEALTLEVLLQGRDVEGRQPGAAPEGGEDRPRVG